MEEFLKINRETFDIFFEAFLREIIINIFFQKILNKFMKKTEMNTLKNSYYEKILKKKYRVH